MKSLPFSGATCDTTSTIDETVVAAAAAASSQSSSATRKNAPAGYSTAPRPWWWRWGARKQNIARQPHLTLPFFPNLTFPYLIPYCKYTINYITWHYLVTVRHRGRGGGDGARENKILRQPHLTLTFLFLSSRCPTLCRPINIVLRSTNYYIFCHYVKYELVPYSAYLVRGKRRRRVVTRLAERMAYIRWAARLCNVIFRPPWGLLAYREHKI